MNAQATTATVTPFTQNLKQQQQKQQTAKEVIAANVQALIEQLEQGHSEGLTAYLLAMGKFHNYSFGNILEIARQKPDATRVAGMYAWNQLGRRVKKGEKGIRILAPMIGIRRKKDAEAEKDIRTQNQPVLVGLQTLSRSQGIRSQDRDAIGKLMVAFARKADESALGRLIVEGVILLSARNQSDAGKVLKNAALTYKVDTDAIALNVKQEFAAKERAKKSVKPSAAKPQGRKAA
jgi:hypothetical protein